MKCKYCNAEFDISLNVCPMCGKPTESYRGGMRRNSVSVNQRDDYIFTKNSDRSKISEEKKCEKPGKDKDEFIDVFSDDDSDKNEKKASVYDDSVFLDDDFELEQKPQNKKKVIILCSVIIVLLCAAVFGCFKLGLFDKKLSPVDNQEKTTDDNVIAVVVNDVTNEQTQKTTEVKTELSQGYYIVKRDNGASMYSTNLIKDSTPVYIASKGSYVEIKSFFIDGKTVLGFAVSNNRYGWLDLSYVEYVGEKLPENATKENTTAQTTQPVTQAPVETTAAPSNSNNGTQNQGTYTVNSGVEDTENGNLNVRSEASSETDNIVAVLYPGDEVTVVEWDGNWAKIEYQGSVLGYVYGTYLDEN